MASRSQLQALADAEARSAGVPTELMRAIVRKESSWNPGATRFEPAYWRKREKKGVWRNLGLPWAGDPRRVASSYGLGQIMYLTALDLGFSRNSTPETLLRPDINLRLTARLLGRLWRKYGGRVEDVAAAYNSGRPFDRAPLVTRTAYVPAIKRFMGLSPSFLGIAPWVWWTAGGVVALGILLTLTQQRRITSGSQRPGTQ